MGTERTTEILRHLSAVSQDVGEFRTETRTQVAGLQTQVGGLQTQVEELRTGLDELRVEVRTGFGELRTEVRALTNRLDRLEAKVLDTHADADELEIRVSALEGKRE